MRAGKLDRKIDIERKTTTLNDFGDPIETWSKIATRRAAGYRPLSGEERFQADQFIASEQVEWTIRYSAAMAEINPLDRVVYPAEAAGSPPPPEPTIYEVIAVHEIGRREGLKLITARRAENPDAG